MIQLGIKALLTQLLPKICPFLRRQMPIERLLVQRLILARHFPRARCLQGRAQLGAPLLSLSLSGYVVAANCRLRPCANRNKNKEQK